MSIRKIPRDKRRAKIKFLTNLTAALVCQGKQSCTAHFPSVWRRKQFSGPLCIKASVYLPVTESDQRWVSGEPLIMRLFSEWAWRQSSGRNEEPLWCEVDQCEMALGPFFKCSKEESLLLEWWMWCQRNQSNGFLILLYLGKIRNYNFILISIWKNFPSISCHNIVILMWSVLVILSLIRT